MRIAILLVSLVGLLSAAQAPVPVEQEPHHRPVFDNGALRVLDVRLPPGYVSLFHVHSLDNVSVRMTDGTIRTDLLTGDGTPQTSPAGRVAYYSASPPYTHRVANTGADPVRIFDVEVLASHAGSSPDTDVPTGHVVVVDNAHVRVFRVSLENGASLAAHSHASGWLEVIVTGARAGQFLWHDAGAVVPAVSASAPTDIVEIIPK